MRIVFVGAVEGSKLAFDAIVAAGMPPALVVTLPPEAAARHSDFVDLTGPARAARIDVLHATNINAPETLDAIRVLAPDLCLVIGWSQICRESFRSIARLGNVGFHPAPLPQLRGRAVIPWTILTDQQTTGSTLFWLDEGVDSGDILLQRTFDVAADETARSLYRKHTDALQAMLPDALALVQSGTPPRIAQDHSQATYCAKRTPEDGLIDWRDDAATVLRLIRAVGDPYPGAFAYCDGDRLTVDEAAPYANSQQYIGLPGQVQRYTDGGFVVRCGDGACIDVRAWRWRSRERPRMHVKLVGFER
jgi:methionyl-tRNA formyltransferase